jgi:hypothetical protein
MAKPFSFVDLTKKVREALDTVDDPARVVPSNVPPMHE